MSLDVLARVGNVTFRSREPETGTTYGFYIDDEGFTGWNDGTEIRRDEVFLPQAHGAFDEPGFNSARVVAISGTCWAETPEQLSWFKGQLTGLLAGGASGRIIVEQPGETLWANGRLAGLTTFTVRAGDPRSATYMFQMWCANPRKYGEARTFSGASGVAVPVYHYGNFPAAPVITVSGTMASGYTVAAGGKSYTVTKPVTADNPHTIDMANGFLSIGGVVQTGGATVATTWAVDGGAILAHTLTPVAGTGTLTVTVTDTHI